MYRTTVAKPGPARVRGCIESFGARLGDEFLYGKISCNLGKARALIGPASCCHRARSPRASARGTSTAGAPWRSSPGGGAFVVVLPSRSARQA